ncbi:hypothetical protein NDU88_004277 [Pleurodeles waltl]|uniref:Uncharacterized protein n=1 Tax=Pleurodeles waltl TaxID=8319 RepID=A0AAV7VJH2_PLEWA|nr:hypothetical protein NDU88_004277 [Pleurodeles waltl]
MSGIFSASGVLVSNRLGVAEVFTTYYAQLYSQVMVAKEEDSQDLLADIQLPLHVSADRQLLEKELTEEEIVRAIRDLKSGTAVGLSGVPIELHKLLATKLTSYLKCMYDESPKLETLPEDQRLASRVVLRKECKPAEDCGSYRPISLLNAEVKTLAKVLALASSLHTYPPRLIRIHARLEHST